MTFLRCIILLQLTSMCAVGQLVRQSKAPAIPEQPGTIVQSLYNEVVARHPVGIPMDADIKTFAPYLSKSLLHGIDLALASERDYYQTHQNPKEKPELDWLEFGLFTGGNEKVSPGTFRVEKTEPENDGSFRVYVRLTWGPPSKPWIWQVAAIVTREEGRFVVDDVVFLEDENTLDPETRLSEILKSGCSGSHWIGYGELRAGLQQDASCVSVHLIPEKAHYKLNETFSFRVSIENCGRGDLVSGAICKSRRRRKSDSECSRSSNRTKNLPPSGQY